MQAGDWVVRHGKWAKIEQIKTDSVRLQTDRNRVRTLSSSELTSLVPSHDPRLAPNQRLRAGGKAKAIEEIKSGGETAEEQQQRLRAEATKRREETIKREQEANTKRMPLEAGQRALVSCAPTSRDVFSGNLYGATIISYFPYEGEGIDDMSIMMRFRAWDEQKRDNVFTKEWTMTRKDGREYIDWTMINSQLNMPSVSSRSSKLTYTLYFAGSSSSDYATLHFQHRDNLFAIRLIAVDHRGRIAEIRTQ